MPLKGHSDEECARMFQAHGAGKAAKQLGVLPRTFFKWRERYEKRTGRALEAPNMRGGAPRPFDPVKHTERHHLTIQDGVVLVGSDSHYWPGIPPSTAHRAFVKFCRELKPKVVIKNGDELDFPSISRFEVANWEKRPEVVEEIEEAKTRLDEIRAAAKGAKFLWPLGNHDARFERKLANLAPEYAHIHGFHLVVKHRFKGGIHATHNNTLWSGKTIVTGHLHSLKVTPLTDLNGTRWGVDSGTLADVHGPQFEYLEDNARNWRSGFVVLTFHRGRLLQPDIALVFDKDHVEFRGKVIRV